MTSVTSFPHLKKDLISIAILMCSIFGTIAVVWWLDNTNGVFGTWASSFYSFIMRS